MATCSVASVASDQSALPSDGSLAAMIHNDAGAAAPAGTIVNVDRDSRR